MKSNLEIIAVMQILTICGIVTVFLLLIGSLHYLKEEKTMKMILGILCFKIIFLIFSKICCCYTLELPHRCNSNVYLQHMSFQ